MPKKKVGRPKNKKNKVGREKEMGRTMTAAALIRMGKSYREIGRILGVSLGTCSKANKLLISQGDLVNGKLMRQIVNLLEMKVDIKTISKITVVDLNIVVDMMNLMHARKYMQGIFESLYESIGKDAEFDKIYKGFWRDFSVGSMYLEYIGNKIKLVYQSFSDYEMGLKVEYFDDMKLLGRKLHELYNPKSKIYLIDDKKSLQSELDYKPGLDSKQSLGYSRIKLEIDEIDIISLEGGKFQVNYHNPDTFDDSGEFELEFFNCKTICNSKTELDSFASSLLGIDGYIVFPEGAKFHKNGKHKKTE